MLVLSLGEGNETAFRSGWQISQSATSQGGNVDAPQGLQALRRRSAVAAGDGTKTAQLAREHNEVLGNCPPRLRF